MNFSDAVRNTLEIAECLKAGLQALGSNRHKIRVEDTRSLTGSVDIDDCLAKRYPNAPRWDYVFSYKERIYYVEVHHTKVAQVKCRTLLQN